MAKKKNKKPEKEEKHVWAIAYINRDFIDNVEKELKRYNYNIETYIPTVKIIKKKFKGRNVFEEVPLFFNYGFFKIPYSYACNPEYLMELRSRINCIYGWVKDPALTVRNKTRLRSNNKEDFNAIPHAALASDTEIAEIIKTTSCLDLYSAEELDRFKKGDFIQLKGYPFDDMPAKIVEINYKKGEIKVELLLESLVKEVTVAFENVFYTVYQGHDDALSNGVNIDDLESKNKGNTDKLMFKQDFYGE